jgi:2-hydroxymethylglutarate dehydrogenase
MDSKWIINTSDKKRPYSRRKRNMMKIGFIGTGRMGNAVCLNLLKAGFRLTVIDINKESYKNLVAMGAYAAESLSEMGQQSELIMTSLPKDEILQEVIVGENGILTGVNPGTIIIDIGTSSPRTARLIGEKAALKGVDFLDAPVSAGGVEGAKQGTLSIMVGGKRSIFEKVKFVLEKMGNKIFYVGELGAGQSMKLVNNLLHNMNRLALLEGLVLGAKAGLDPKMMLEVIEASSGNSYDVKRRGPDILKGDFESKNRASLNGACKTLKLISEFADELNMPLLMTSIARQIYNMAKAKGFGAEQPISIIKMYEEALGVQVRAK